MKIRKNDTIMVISGKDKGKKGKVVAVYSKQNSVLVEGVNMKIKHIKKTDQNATKVGRVQVSRPLNISKVMFFDSEKSKPTRLGMKVEGKKLLRISKVSNKAV